MSPERRIGFSVGSVSNMVDVWTLRGRACRINTRPNKIRSACHVSRGDLRLVTGSRGSPSRAGQGRESERGIPVAFPRRGEISVGRDLRAVGIDRSNRGRKCERISGFKHSPPPPGKNLLIGEERGATRAADGQLALVHSPRGRSAAMFTSLLAVVTRAADTRVIDDSRGGGTMSFGGKGRV